MDVVAQPALEELDIAEHAVVLRDRHVVFGGGEVRLDDLLGLGAGRGLGEGRDLQELVDRRRLRRLLSEPVSLGERRDLVGVDPIDQPVEMLAQSRVGARAVGRFEQHFDGAVELDSRAVQVSQAKLALAGQEVLL